MLRSLSPWVLALSMLAGCAAPQPEPQPQLPEETEPEIVNYSSVEQWLKLQQRVSEMTTEEIIERLVRVDEPRGAGQLLYKGLLNQQLQTFGAWSRARDAFRELHFDERLTVEQRQLAGILRDYNQNRINWYQRQRDLLIQHAELREELAQAEQDRLLLEQKIHALTEMEAVISTRKE